MTGDIAHQERMRSLIEAGIALTSELSLDAVLLKLAETAADVTGARYAALGVIDRTGSELERFVFTGLTEDQRAAIGDLPRGRGILGALIRETKTLRLHDIAQDPRSVGFPPGHPPMKTFLGVPIVLRGVAYGNLYLTEKDNGEEFDDEDEELITLLAAQAAVAIENARLYEAAVKWLRQLESLEDIGNALTSELDLPRLLDLIASRLRELTGARLVAVAVPGEGGRLRIEAAAGGDLRGTELEIDASKSGRVMERKRSERVDTIIDDPEVDQHIARRMQMQTGLWVPMMHGERAIGVIAAHDKEGPDPRFTEEDLRLAETFAKRAAIAVDLSTRVARDTVRRVVDAQEQERRRLARELHDETGQALTSVILGLKQVEDAKGAEAKTAAMAEVRALVLDTLNGVRSLAVELRPKALDDFGLVPAIERLLDGIRERTGMSIDFEAGLLTARLPSEAETALYRIVQEALTNVLRHADARHVSVSLARKPGSVTAVVEDDGRGFDPSRRVEGLGLLGMRERIALIGGRVAVESRPGAGTTIAVEVPVS